MNLVSQRSWPYPRWIAHRGAGLLAPENTRAAFKCGLQHGYRLFECDAKLSRDEVVFLLHDDTLERTTNGQGVAGQHDWSDLATLDAGQWHSPRYKGEPLWTLTGLADFCSTHRVDVNIEIKPTLGYEVRTGEVIAQQVQDLWRHASTPPLLSSFSIEALWAAKTTAPDLPRALLLAQWSDDALTLATKLGCVALVLHESAWTAMRITQTQAQTLRAWCYTVNAPRRAHQLLAWGIDGLITDEVARFNPSSSDG